MSRVQGTRRYLFTTQVGVLTVKRQVVTEYDVEDLVRVRAISQARAVQFSNLGKIIDQNAQVPTQSIPSVFVDNDEVLPEG